MCNLKCCESKGGCGVAITAKILVIIGGLNWGLVGLGMLMGGDWNVVHMILGSISTLEAIVYLLVGVAAVMEIFCCKCGKCSEVSSADSKTEGMQ